MHGVWKIESGVYSRTSVDIQVERNSSFYFSMLFVPLFLVTCLSFISFWIDVKQRMFLILPANLFIITFKIWFRVTMLPPVSYSVCAIEYIDICLTITIFVLMEFFAIVIINNVSLIYTDGNMEFENINL